MWHLITKVREAQRRVKKYGCSTSCEDTSNYGMIQMTRYLHHGKHFLPWVTCHFYPFGSAECLSLWQLVYSLKTGVTTNNRGPSLSQANSWSIHRPLSIYHIIYIYIILSCPILSYIKLSYSCIISYYFT